MIITSPTNPTVRHAQALLTQHRTRKKSGQTVIEGVHLLDAYVKQGLTVNKLLVSQSAASHHEVLPLLSHAEHKDMIVIADTLYKQIRTLGDGIDMMAIVDIPDLDLVNIQADCLILDGLQDTGNIGTLLRTASAVGIQSVITTPHTAHLWSPKVLRAGMGAHFSLSIYEHITTDEILQKVQTPFYATSSHTDTVIYDHDLTQPIAWVLGHEGQGVSDDFLKHATPIALPQPGGQESLNVSIAGSVCFYEMLRQRRYPR
ncbi:MULTISPECIES: TrmH family RNA methyltransferase [Moraxella]|uniref:tRNA/rRNA methyltransferase n=1 Tax=Moraxella catarrhalis TaxID=480 RepID=A0A198UJQ6_MORCA|nr:RNA methyltransferase [Moraxella catarrhalis]OAU95847.1 TRNA/rRNA methyltransferase [Moraxella catarrhalis]OAU96565.1 TRNA/rRNA methyltransferase [Moraxella catarrhalis]OAU99055.1 TRNA/rRNA methyltransferase [Moraxella catarrhalis]OAV00794.1 TRNA/rRNA methyltransferase [Moraxella catarrhalis]STY81270.1 23S rRNA (guanosine-2'-O-)-methyltransferase RlmB [Moraxella catarrhalis]